MGALDRIQIAALGQSLDDLASEAQAAERAGIEGVWAVELYRSTMTQATWLAANTERIGIGTGITWGFVRSPMILALSALDIDEASGGRFRLGLGAGVKRLNETWHGAEYGRPAPHLRETVEAVRLIMEKAHTGEPIRFQGTYHDIDIKGWVRPHPPVRERVPIYTAAVQEGMARMAGDVADGLLGHLICSPRWLEEVVIPNFELGLQRSGRSRANFDFIPGVCCAIDEDEEAAYEAARRTIAFYATVRTYAPLWEMHGFGEQAEAVRNAFRAGDFANLASHVTDEMVDTYCAAGPPDKVRARVERIAELGDAVSLTPPTYFIEPERIAAYQRRIIETFAPAA
ncbi:MAG TPA: LLM class flavin-dependent oxidoreductase [Solirubrobacterales bacterium]|jgi:probable F420-dependent oxidoreductase